MIKKGRMNHTKHGDTIQEEDNPSIKSVSPLTDASRSRKSARISMSPGGRFNGQNDLDQGGLPALVNV